MFIIQGNLVIAQDKDSIHVTDSFFLFFSAYTISYIYILYFDTIIMEHNALQVLDSALKSHLSHSIKCSREFIHKGLSLS